MTFSYRTGLFTLSLCLCLAAGAGCASDDDGETADVGIGDAGTGDGSPTDAAADEICDNTIDDDGDRIVDCLDPDCVDSPLCEDDAIEICDNELDDDEDGLVDCDDDECEDSASCTVVEERDCDNGLDDDNDGTVDCDDEDCASAEECDLLLTEVCDNRIDDDSDGAIDCDDADCVDDPSCAITPDEVCDNETDDDGDGDTDCDDADCAGTAECVEEGEEICNNDADDDEDGDVDCDDTDCDGTVLCELPPDEICDNDIDDDEDGDVDCDDTDCDGTAPCTEGDPEICDNGTDDDDDGDIDCDDSDCEGDDACPASTEEICDNDMDDDDDGDFDCEDEDCADDDACASAGLSCPEGVPTIDVTDEDETEDLLWEVSATYPDAGNLLAPATSGCVFEDAETGPEVVFLWTVPETGTYAFTTETEANVAAELDTVLYLLTECATDSTPLACNDDASEVVDAPLTSFITADLTAGQEIAIVVDTYDDADAGAEVELVFGGLGEAPTVDSFEAYESRSSDWIVIEFAGTDPDADVVGYQIDLPSGFASIETFTIGFVESALFFGDDDRWIAHGFLPRDAYEAATELRVIDSRGNSATAPDATIAATRSDGDDCFPPVSTRAVPCDGDFVCNVPADAFSGTCGAATGEAPTLSAVDFVAFHPDGEDDFCLSEDFPNGVELSMSGTSDARVVAVEATGEATGGDAVTIRVVSVPESGSYTVTPRLCFSPTAEYRGATFDFAVRDEANRTSDTLEFTIPSE